jgi:hypothetical protein
MILRAMLAVAYAAGRASIPRQVKGDHPDKKEYPGPPGWEFGVGLTTPHIKKLIVTKVKQRNKLDRFNDDGRKRTRHTEITLGVRRWRELVINREKWRGIVRQAKAHSGL